MITSNEIFSRERGRFDERQAQRAHQAAGAGDLLSDCGAVHRGDFPLADFQSHGDGQADLFLSVFGNGRGFRPGGVTSAQRRPKTRKTAQKSRPVIVRGGSFRCLCGTLSLKRIGTFKGGAVLASAGKGPVHLLAALIQAVAADDGVCSHFAAFIKAVEFAVYPVPAGGHVPGGGQVVPGISKLEPTGLCVTPLLQ